MTCDDNRVHLVDIFGAGNSDVQVHSVLVTKNGNRFSGCFESNLSHFQWKVRHLLSPLLCPRPATLHGVHFRTPDLSGQSEAL